MLLSLLKKLDLPRATDLAKPMLYQLIIAYVLISLPMINLFPMWIPALAGLTIALKLASIRFRFVVSKWITIIMLIAFGTLIFANASVLGKEYTGVALLFVFASLKILEAREQRDAFLLMLIYLLLIMGALMAQDSPLAFVYLVFCFLYNIYIQLRIAQPDDLGLTLKQNIKSIAKILLVSIPFVVILFFLFPRINPLWKTPTAPIARTGLSDEMTPESISELVQDGSMAFRVKFKNDNIPENDKLYWRGPVLTNYDGKTWRRSSANNQQPELSFDPNSQIDYTIVHDGGSKDWVVPLDMLGKLTNNTLITHNFEVQAKDPISKPTAFDLTSYTSYRTGQLNAITRQENTFLPPKLFPRARALAKQYKQSSSSNKAFADQLWQHFRDTEFYYDLAPPTGNANIDTFLFDNQVGYCQHYSSAFVFMLRSQGVPARVVTGYQGGEQNPISKELEVKQLNAHAWAEVYFDDKGWVRYDPTAAVAPDRVNLGTPFGVAANTGLISTGARWETQSALFRQLTTSMRAMNAFWQNWIINYDSDKQNSLWKKLGLGNYKYVAWLLFIIALGPITLLLWWWYKRRQAARFGDEVYRAILPFFRYLEKINLRPTDAQALSDWLEYNQQSLGETKKYAENVVQHYYRLRYSSMQFQHKADTVSLNKAIRLFIERHRQYKRTVGK